MLKTSPAELPARVAALADERRRLERELADARKALALAGPPKSGGDASREIAGIKTVLRLVEDVAAKDLKALADDAKQKIGSGVVAFVTVAEGRASLVVGVTDGSDRARQRRRSGARGLRSLGRQGRRRPARHGAGRRSRRRQGQGCARRHREALGRASTRRIAMTRHGDAHDGERACARYAIRPSNASSRTACFSRAG